MPTPGTNAASARASASSVGIVQCGSLPLPRTSAGCSSGWPSTQAALAPNASELARSVPM